MAKLDARFLRLAALLTIVACTPPLNRPAGPFDPSRGVVILTDEWVAPPLNVPGKDWLLCDLAPSQGRLDRIPGNTGDAKRIELPQGHSLVIPDDAFPQPFRDFVLMQPKSRYVSVFAHVERLQLFSEHVRLTLDYGSRGCTVPDPAALVIFRINDNGSHDPLVTHVGAGTTVYADVDHLSTFAIAQ